MQVQTVRRAARVGIGSGKRASRRNFGLFEIGDLKCSLSDSFAIQIQQTVVEGCAGIFGGERSDSLQPLRSSSRVTPRAVQQTNRPPPSSAVTPSTLPCLCARRRAFGVGRLSSATVAAGAPKKGGGRVVVSVIASSGHSGLRVTRDVHRKREPDSNPYDDKGLFLSVARGWIRDREKKTAAHLASAPAPPPPAVMTLPLPSTTNFGASYIELIMADRAMTASSLSDSAYHSRSRSSGVRAAAGDEAFSFAEEGDAMAEMLDEVGSAQGEDEEEDDEEATVDPEEEDDDAELAYAASSRAGSSVLNLFLVRLRKYCLKL